MELTNVNFILESESQLSTQHDSTTCRIATETDGLGESSQVTVFLSCGVTFTRVSLYSLVLMNMRLYLMIASIEYNSMIA